MGKWTHKVKSACQHLSQDAVGQWFPTMADFIIQRTLVMSEDIILSCHNWRRGTRLIVASGKKPLMMLNIMNYSTLNVHSVEVRRLL